MQERLVALEEQKVLDDEAIEEQLRTRELVEECVKKQQDYRHDLDVALEDKKKAIAAGTQQLQNEEEKMKIYIKTKKVRLTPIVTCM